MGNDFEDKWTTPKHLKIERKGEPRGFHRGSMKKKDRRKGPKARMDEIISAKNDVKRCYEWIQDEKVTNWGLGTRAVYAKWHAKAVQKLRKLLKKALEDDIITKKGAEYVQEGICKL